MNSLFFLVPLSQALNKSLFEGASFFFKELLSFFFKGQAFPALEIRWGLSPCPQMLALDVTEEVTAEVENCEQVSFSL